MVKNYFSLFFSLAFLATIGAQETVTFSGYDGTGSTVVATSTVNDEITIVFEDVDIINNFYTENQTEIYMYGGLDTSSGGFQGAPGFGDLGAQPTLALFNDSDSAAGPNTYSVTINLANHYTGVADGTMIFGFNLLFQNQFGGGGNNQTADLYIDLTDAMKMSTLSTDSFAQLNEIKAYVNNKQLSFPGNNSDLDISIFNILGQNVLTRAVSGSETIDMSNEATGVYLVKIQMESGIKTKKIILH